VLVMIQLALGWRGMFVAAGSLGIVWAICFYALYRDPARSRRANPAELQLIAEGGGKVDWQRRTRRGVAPAAGIVPAGRLFASRKMWGLLLAHMGETCANWFFLTWFPTYLVRYRHIEFLKVGFMATLPFLAAFVGVLLSGYLSDLLYRSGCSLSVARKTPIVTGLILATAIIGANFVDNPAFIIAFMTLAFFGSGLAAISWSVVSSIAPANLVGLASGAFNFIGTSMGIVVPIVIGALISGGDFSPALVFVGGMACLSVFSWLVIVGRIETVQ
jgi:ACS family D-galactonate transporter-like MFS transporter